MGVTVERTYNSDVNHDLFEEVTLFCLKKLRDSLRGSVGVAWFRSVRP